ncbi:MAG: glutathione S-transferase N-terminal domain-containing protein, partial [Luminiphilus sp.]|nr:glutathione S-transferase N-terminal domain-containing protein [Luminiphilus sp.]
MTTVPTLYSFRRCPYAMRARMAIAYAGIEVGLREVVLKDKPAAMLAVSSKGTVPVLIETNGRVIDESLDVMAWALDQHDSDHWLSGMGLQ